MNYVQEYDPLQKFKRLLLRYNRFSEDELKVIEDRVKEEVKEAHRKVMASPDPDPASIFDFVNAEPYPAAKYPDGLHHATGDSKKLIEALNETLKAEFRTNPRYIYLGSRRCK